MKQAFKKYRFGILWTLLLFGLTRYWAFSHVDEKSLLAGDGGHMYSIAHNLAINGVYSEKGDIPTQSAIWRAPVWPAVLSFYAEFINSPLKVLAFKMTAELILFFLVFLLLSVFQVTAEVFYFIMTLFVLEPQIIKYAPTFNSENFTGLLLLLLAISFLLYFFYNSSVSWYLTFLFASICVLSHPVCILFVIILLMMLSIKSFLDGRVFPIIAGTLIFVSVLGSWMFRNALTFGEGVCITSSQGAVFSKSWNRRVLVDFTNTCGDLADEDLNLQDADIMKNYSSMAPLVKSRFLSDATWNFIRNQEISTLFRISFRKIISGLNPLPETSKSGKLELMGTIFRFGYLLIGLTAVVTLIRKRFNFNSAGFTIALVITAVWVGQVLVSALLYTGLRFNSIYTPIHLLFGSILVLELKREFKRRSSTF